MTSPADKAPKVPRVIQEAGRAVERDIKPALRLMGRIFFNTWLGDQSYVKVPPGAEQPRIKVRQQKPRAQAPRPPAPSDSSPGPVVIDAELIEECLTCGGSKKVGRLGHEVPCPSCAGK